MATSVTESADLLGRTDREVLVAIFTTLTRIAVADTGIRTNLSSGDFRFTYYPVRGQEAIPAGIAPSLRSDDMMVTTYRCLHDVIAKGASMREVMAEMFGRAAGTSKGKGGPMHLSDPRSGLMATTGIVGGGVPIANGLALATRLRGGDQVTVCNF